MAKLLQRYSKLFSIMITMAVILIVDYFKVPNPNVVLTTVFVYLTFLYGYFAGTISAGLVILYSMYFFSKDHSMLRYDELNLQKIIVIMIFIPLLVYIVGSLKKRYLIKEKELEKEKEKFERLSITDYMTELYNRKYFNERYSIELQSARDHNKPISILLIDIDFFKQYNDSYGHIAGDDCIKRVAAAVRNEVDQQSDFLARYGGEEFVVICPDTPCDMAMQKAERIRQAVLSLALPHNLSKINQYVTISIGVASSVSSADFENFTLLNKADMALYQAKHNGRDRVSEFSE